MAIFFMSKLYELKHVIPHDIRFSFREGLAGEYFLIIRNGFISSEKYMLETALLIIESEIKDTDYYSDIFEFKGKVVGRSHAITGTHFKKMRNQQKNLIHNPNGNFLIKTCPKCKSTNINYVEIETPPFLNKDDIGLVETLIECSDCNAESVISSTFSIES